MRSVAAPVGSWRVLQTVEHPVATQDDVAFYERRLRLIADVEETEGLFRQTAIGPSGKLRIDVPDRIGRPVIAPSLPDFLARYPQIDIELGITDRAVNLVEDRVDCRADGRRRNGERNRWHRGRACRGGRRPPSFRPASD
jgi:LysR family transcriptional regulator, regulator for bpeEF and oprC